MHMFSSIVDHVYTWLLTWYYCWCSLFQILQMVVPVFLMQRRHVRAQQLDPATLVSTKRSSRGDMVLASPVDAVRLYRQESVDETVRKKFGALPQSATALCMADGDGSGAVQSSHRELPTLSYGELLGATDEIAQCVAALLASCRRAMVTSAVSASPSDGLLLQKRNTSAVEEDNKTRVKAVAVLMHNSLDYYPTSFGVAAATNYLNALSRDTTDGDEFDVCCGALLNTNIQSNSMLCSAIVTAAAPVLLLESCFLGLLFTTDGDGDNEKRISLPEFVESVAVTDGECGFGEKSWEQLRSLAEAHGIRLVSLPQLRQAVRSASTPESFFASFRQSSDETSRQRRDKGEQHTKVFVSPELAGRRGRRFRMTDPVLMIYTSGTTGLPKAAKMTHMRWRGAVALISMALRPRPNPATGTVTSYNVLPMYHSAGGIFGPGLLLSGAQRGVAVRMISRRKFSARHFKQDLSRFKVDVIHYIGEILRYAVGYEGQSNAATPPNTCGGGDAGGVQHNRDQHQHVVQYALGNGLRPDVWGSVKKVLGVQRICEFYASTEGNVGCCNTYDEPHAIGHYPVFPWPLHNLLSPFRLRLCPLKQVKYDPDTEEPYRGSSTGRCVLADFDEPGELLGAVAVGHDPIGLRRFDGYMNDATSSKKKVLRGVFSNGDAYFRTGDLVRVDRRGFVYFVDRVGDTFRWKGENVSTLEVANALNSVRVVRGDGTQIAVQEAVVFGVAVGGCEGKAGMARIELRSSVAATTITSGEEAAPPTSVLSPEEEALFLEERLFGLLHTTLDTPTSSSLPKYAIPLFIRLDSCCSSSSSSNDEGRGGDGSDGRPELLNTPPPPPPPSFKEKSVQSTNSRQKEEGEDMTGTFKYKKTRLQQEGYGGGCSSPFPPDQKVRIFTLKKRASSKASTSSTTTSAAASQSSYGYVPITHEEATAIYNGTSSSPFLQ